MYKVICSGRHEFTAEFSDFNALETFLTGIIYRMHRFWKGDVHYGLDSLFDVNDDTLKIIHPDGTEEVNPRLTMSGNKTFNELITAVQVQ
jgi:hypothetical protein